MKKQRLTVISFSLILLALLGGLILCSGEESWLQNQAMN